ncbi:MAG: S-layer homology domain-containing protein [Lachnoclostridium sp.]
MTKFPDGEKVNGFAADAASWAVAEGLISGDKGRLLPQESINRVECAAIIQRFMER